MRKVAIFALMLLSISRPAAARPPTIEFADRQTRVNGVLIPNNCPPAPIPQGPLAAPGLTDVPYNHLAFAGETSQKMFERHKREAIAEQNSPCQQDFQKRFDHEIAARKAADRREIATRGHEYLTKIG